MHLRPHGRVQAVGRDQQPPAHLLPFARARFDQRRHALRILAVARHPAAQLHRVGTEALLHRVEQQHLQLAAVHRILRPLVAGQQAARLGIHIMAVAAHQRPFPGLDADGVERGGVETQVVELAHGIGLQVDAHAQGLEFAHSLEHPAGHADLVQGERHGHAGNAATGDEDHILFVHGICHSTVTLLARFRGLSTSVPRAQAV